ncbi:MAG TPA: hypothetical protein V6D43_04500 [Candidatus Sericytochromatia bacterium]
MTTLFRRIKPYSFPITLDLIAKFLHIPKSLIVRAECWAYVLFVHRCDKGGQFISYRKLAIWLKAIASIIQTCTTLDDLWQVGLWIKQECEKFDYDKPVLEYLRRVWAKHRDYLRDLQQGSDATTQAVAVVSNGI